MKKYLNFDVMITPTIIKILFWIGVAASLLGGIIFFFSGLATMFSGFRGAFFGGLFTMISGVFIAVFGVLVSRIYCELIIVAFKALVKLTSIDSKLTVQNKDVRNEVIYKLHSNKLKFFIYLNEFVIKNIVNYCLNL